MSSEPSTIGGDQTVDGLRRELAEAREGQAATAEILAATSSSPTDPRGVYDKIAESAARLCDADDATIRQVEGDHLRLVAHHGPIHTADMLPLTRGLLGPRAVLDRRTIHSIDRLADGGDGGEYAESRDYILRTGIRTMLAIPLILAGEATGVINIRRIEVRPFTDRQIELLKIFADQAVIAIENTRLFEAEQTSKRELQDALDRQTATAQVLEVISRSPGELEPVFQALLANAVRICEAKFGVLFRYDDPAFRAVAWVDVPPTYAEYHRQRADRRRRGERLVARGSLARLLETRNVVQTADALAEPVPGPAAKCGGARSLVAVPMFKETEFIGAIILYRQEVRAFTDKQIVLLKSFANQAVIAIENARLLDELHTRQRELEARTAELEIASQHKSQFVANMSHELRTPLAAMLGYAELLQEGIYGALPEKSLSILTRVRSNGKHLLGLINTVLDISKIEAGQFKLNLGEYAWGSIVETVMVATESLASTKKLAFKTEVTKGLPYGLGDEQRLTQVLLNLVGNAIKFTDAGEVRVTAGAANGHFAVSVSDTGPGIPAEECERIFEKFRQVDGSNTRAKGGTGLGLAIAREIVEMHGGRIWVESRIGEGSTFRMELPVRAQAAAG
jgi:signal transduction histidine kinase